MTYVTLFFILDTVKNEFICEFLFQVGKCILINQIKS